MRRLVAETLLGSGNVSAIVVSGTNTAYTNSFVLQCGQSFGIDYKATSAGAVNMQIDIEQSNTAPTTEYASDTSYVIPDSVSAIATTTDELQHYKAVSPVVTKYARFKITGLGTGTPNAAGNTIAIKISKIEED